jgi:type II secretory pathway pseudopilin PulG
MAPRTTFATGRGRTPRSRRSAAAPPTLRPGCSARAAGRAGFTLLEIALTVGLVVLLLSLAIASFTNWYEADLLPEGARQFEGLLRLARADAASRGRQVRLVFDPETLRPRLLWEPSPLEEPGNFVSHPGEWAHHLPVELVRVSRCERTGASAVVTLKYQDSDQLESEEGNILQPLTFYPDGSCDSAIIELVALAEDDVRTAVLVLDGDNGTIRLYLLTPTELEEFYEE